MKVEEDQDGGVKVSNLRNCLRKYYFTIVYTEVNLIGVPSQHTYAA